SVYDIPPANIWSSCSKSSTLVPADFVETAPRIFHQRYQAKPQVLSRIPFALQKSEPARSFPHARAAPSKLHAALRSRMPPLSNARVRRRVPVALLRR